MRVDWLDDILAVIDTGSLSRAAEARLLTQPAFSRRIKAIEHVLGIEFVDRRRKPARPTQALAAQEQRIRALSDEMRAFVADLRRDSRQTRNRIVIASQHAITTSLSPQVVAILTKDSDTSVRLRSVNRDECNAMLFAKQADITLTYRTPGEPALLGEDYVEDMQIGTEELVPVFSADHAAGLMENYEHGDLPIIAYPADVFLGKVLNAEILPRIAGTAIVRPVSEPALTLAALQLSKAGVGLAWVPKSLTQADLASGALRDMSQDFRRVTLDVVASRLLGRKSPVEDGVWAVIGRHFIGPENTAEL